MILLCSRCGYRWGPVGVMPYDETSPVHQGFMICSACKEIQEVKLKVNEELGDKGDYTCKFCAAQLDVLRYCPLCGEGTVSWRPVW